MTGFATLLKDHLNAALGLVYPEVCQICGQARAGSTECFLCSTCRGKVHWIELPFCQRCGFPYEGDISTPFECAKCRNAEWEFSSARSAVVARDTVLEVIHRYKYQHALWFEPFLAELMVEAALPELTAGHWDYIVPVPLHATKQREREFNQAERLARHLARATRIPLKTRLIRRTAATRTQTLLTREERLANVRKAFALSPGVRLNGERIVLVDDVFTTGATTGACARVLRSSGAGDVCVWTVARGI